MLRGTPFHSRTAPLCEAQNWRRWSGFVVASSYELTHEWEYTAIRNSAALFDLSPLFKYTIQGRHAGRLLNRVVTRDIRKCQVGQVIYTPWCDEHGKVIDDGTIARLADDTYRLTAADPNLRWLTANAYGMDVEIVDISEQIANLSLQGPLSREILSRAVGQNFNPLKYYRWEEAEIGGVGVTISRTGYSGDLGYEIWIPADHATQVWDALIDAGQDYRIVPAGMIALDIARIEAGLLLIEVDYVSAHKALIDSRKSSPFELGLGWTVDLQKEHFIGRSALSEEKAHPTAWHFTGVIVDWPAYEALFLAEGLPPQLPMVPNRSSLPLYAGSRWVGYVSSSTWSPVLKHYIGLAHILSPYAETGTPLMIEVTVEHQRKLSPVQVVKPPFFNPQRKRA